MSEAVTNSEIEDVLSSVRRLVAQEGRHPAAPAIPAGGGAPVGRLILTQAQRVESQGHDSADPASRDEGPTADSGAPEPARLRPVSVKGGAGPLPAPDFKQLEATIAELEAAVSATDSAWEPDGTDEQLGESAGASNVTALYGKLNFVHRALHARKAEGGDAAAVAPAPIESVPEPAPATPAAMTVPEAQAPSDTLPDDRLDEAFDEAVIDEDMLRILVARMVREELQGQLGERITHQVRKLVRAEIARVLDERNLL